MGALPTHPTNFKIPLSSVVERLAVNQEALIRYSDDRNVEGEPIYDNTRTCKTFA